MKVNTHGYPMLGLRAAAGATNIQPYTMWVQISYHRVTGRICTDLHTNSWTCTEYRDPDIGFVCRTPCKMGMQEIADAIAWYMDGFLAAREWMESLADTGETESFWG